MNTKQYRNFVAVAKCHSISGAARELLIPQPALTNQIKRIEAEFGAKLFIRHPRSMELTDAGRALYKTAEIILQMEENACTEIANLSKGEGGTLNIGISQFLPDSFFQEWLLAYLKRYPTVIISLYEQTRDEIFDKLKAGVIEIAIIRAPHQLHSAFQILTSFDEYFYACRIADCPYLIDKKNGELLSLTDLEGIPISAPRGMYRYIGECCYKAGFIPIWRAISNSRQATLKLAELGNMVAVLSMAKDFHGESDNLIRNRIIIDDLRIQRCVVVLRGKHLSPTTQNFINLLKHIHIMPRSALGVQ